MFNVIVRLCSQQPLPCRTDAGAASAGCSYKRGYNVGPMISLVKPTNGKIVLQRQTVH